MGILPGREHYESDEAFAKVVLKCRRANGLSVREAFGDNACSVCGWGRKGVDPCLDCREVMAMAGEPVPGETVEKPDVKVCYICEDVPELERYCSGPHPRPTVPGGSAPERSIPQD